MHISCMGLMLRIQQRVNDAVPFLPLIANPALGTPAYRLGGMTDNSYDGRGMADQVREKDISHKYAYTCTLFILYCC